MPMLARDAMTSDVKTVSPDATVADAALTMRASGHGALPVVDAEGNLLGVLKKFAVVRRCLPEYLEQVGDLFRSGEFMPFRDRVKEVGLLSVRDLMSPNPPTASQDTPLAQVAATMIMQDARQVFVVQGRKLVGIVGMQDIVDKIAWPEPGDDSTS
ncbi:MAG: CBS domain-containing protein [Armatimonadota bacterium]|nr:CBS domain-containing protein [Armatimonadota bacterium]